MGTLEEKCPSGSSHNPPLYSYQQLQPHTINMKWTVFLAGMLMMARAAPVADPEAIGLPAIAIPAITGSALVDGLLLGKVAFLKAAILAGLLSSQGGDETDAGYGAPIESYGAPQDSYGAPSAPVVDTYGSPAAAPLPSYNNY